MSRVPRDLEAELSRARARIVATEAQLRTIIEMNADGIIIVDQEGLIRFANPAAAALFSSIPEALVGQPFGFPLVEGDLTEIDIVQRKERPAVTEMRAVKIDWEGEDAYLASLRDVTAKRRAEEALRQKEEQLRQAQRMEAIGRLAAEVAHDINNVLMGISGCSRVALQSLESDALAYVFVREIQRATEQGVALVRELLTHSRRRSVDPRPIDLNAIVTSMMTLLRRLLVPAIELTTDLDPALWRVTADPAQIEQILMNLVVNARDAMPRGGKIVIATRNRAAGASSEARARVVDEEDHVELSVTDDGEGMDDATKERAFEPLFTTKPPGKGTGLGLSTVRGIVEENGGHVYLESERGRGASIQIYLPGRASMAEEGHAQAPTQAMPGTETVLLVDDEELIRMSLRYELSTNGYRTLDAASGANALELCARYPWPIHVLITDLRMPGMSGRELARRAALLRPGIKIIFMTGYAGGSLTREKLAAIGHGIIEKPFAPDVLVSRVRELLGTAHPDAATRAPIVPRAVSAKAATPEHEGQVKAGAPVEVASPAAAEPVEAASASRADRAEAPTMPARDARGGAADDHAKTSATILLVEDHSATRLALRRLLQSAERVILDAGTADEALALCRNRSAKIDLLLTDISLGGTDGVALAHALQEVYPDMGIIFMSGHSRESLEPRFRIPGGAAFIEKPIDYDELDRAIDDALRRGRERGA